MLFALKVLNLLLRELDLLEDVKFVFDGIKFAFEFLDNNFKIDSL